MQLGFGKQSASVTMSPYDGVVPPSGMPAHSSTRLAPPSWAAKQLSTLFAHISNSKLLPVSSIQYSCHWFKILLLLWGMLHHMRHPIYPLWAGFRAPCALGSQCLKVSSQSPPLTTRLVYYASLMAKIQNYYQCCCIF